MDAVTTVLSSGVRLATPLAIAASGEVIAERAGTLNISVDAFMLTGAFAAAWGSSATGSGAAGLLIGIAAGVMLAFVHAQFSHRLAANTFVVGLTLNTLALGLTTSLHVALDYKPVQVGKVNIPLLQDIPVIGPAFFQQRWPGYLVVAIVPAAWYLLYRTRWGLEVRGSGEDPQAVDVNGVRVNARRRQALYVSGATAGLAGGYLSVAQVGLFNQNMTAGRGFIVIAAVIFGGWTIKGALAGCALFGLADALRLALPPLGIQIVPQLLIAAPYLLSIIAMILFARNNRQPSALSRPFVRGLV